MASPSGRSFTVTPGLAEAFQLQAQMSPGLGSPLYGDLLTRALDDLQQGGAVAEVFDGWQGAPVPDAVVLRFMGGVHRLVLDGKEPRLARHFPSAGGTPDAATLGNDFIDLVQRNVPYLQTQLRKQVQTNEVRRSAALLGGFLTVAQETGLPLRLREIGSSAGLNLHWDRYRYELGEHRWGSEDSKVVIRSTWHGRPPCPIDTPTPVLDRAGCDIAPMDIRNDETLRTLESFIWPDQLDRLAQLHGAAAVAKQQPMAIERCNAGEWLQRQLAEVHEGSATVLFHSVMWWYIPADEQQVIRRLIEDRGRRATSKAPFAYLQMELRETLNADIALKLWPGGEERLLGVTHPHGKEVWWGDRHPVA